MSIITESLIVLYIQFALAALDKFGVIAVSSSSVGK